MFLEKIGHLLFSHLRPAFFYLLTVFPLCLATLDLWIQNGKLKEIERKYFESSKKGKLALEKKGRKDRFLKRYGDADSYFLSEKIESLRFLAKEKKELMEMIDHPALKDKRMAEERLRYISSDKNHLVFAEEALRSHAEGEWTIKETEEKLRHSVEVNAEDLKQLLSRLEDLPIGLYTPIQKGPQILVTDFQLSKKDSPFSENCFEINMRLLTREFNR